MGADCKSVGLAYEGSNPSPATPRYDGPRPSRSGAVCAFRGRSAPGRWRSRCAPAAARPGTASRTRSPRSRVQRTVTSAPSVSADQASSAVPPSASWSATAACAAARVSGSSRADALGVDHGLVGAVGRRQRGAVAHRLHLLLLEEGVGGGDRAERHQRRHQPADQHERQRRAPLAVAAASARTPGSVGGRLSTACGRGLWTLWTPDRVTARAAAARLWTTAARGPGGGRRLPACRSRCPPPRCTRSPTRCARRPRPPTTPRARLDRRRRRRRDPAAAAEEFLDCHRTAGRALAGELRLARATRWPRSPTRGWGSTRSARRPRPGARADDPRAAGAGPARPAARRPGGGGGPRPAASRGAVFCLGGARRATWPARPRGAGLARGRRRRRPPAGRGRRRPRAGRVRRAVAAATGRLGAHRDLLEEVRGRSPRCGPQQDEDYAGGLAPAGRPRRTSARRGVPPIPRRSRSPRSSRPPRRPAVGEHAALLAEVADDAAATAARAGRVRAPSSAARAGRATPAGRSPTSPALLPGWGDAELAARGAQLAGGAARRPRRPRSGTPWPRRRWPTRTTTPSRVRCSPGWAPRAWSCCSSPSGPAPSAGQPARRGCWRPRSARPSDRSRQPTRWGRCSPATTSAGRAVRQLGRRSRRAWPPSSLPGATPVLGRTAVRRPSRAGRVSCCARERAHGLSAARAPCPPPGTASLSDPAAAGRRRPGRRRRTRRAAAALLASTDVWQTLLVPVLGRRRRCPRRADAAGAAQAQARRATTPCAPGWRPSARAWSTGTRPDWTVGRGIVAAVSPALARAVAAHVDGRRGRPVGGRRRARADRDRTRCAASAT